VILVFQPAEEGMAGARAMINDGLFERFPMDAIFGLHNWPGMEAGHFAIHDGPVMAAADRFDVEVTGIGCHAAMPHLGVDPVVAAAALVQSFQTIAARTVDPLDAAVVSTTVLKAGQAYNVIPDRVELAGTVRTFREEVRATVRRRMQDICDGIGATYGVGVELHYHAGYPATVNSSAEAAACATVARALVGADAVTTSMRPSMGSEDFAFFLREKPGCYVWLGNGPGEGGCLLHNPRYDFNDELIPVGSAYWLELVRHLLPAPR
jgi:amidohydrolase